MFDWVNGETLWILMNRILGIVALACGIVVSLDIVRGVRLQIKARQQLVPLDDHAFDLPGLGLTMADGGERKPEKTKADGAAAKKEEK